MAVCLQGKYDNERGENNLSNLRLSNKVCYSITYSMPGIYSIPNYVIMGNCKYLIVLLARTCFDDGTCAFFRKLITSRYRIL